MNDIQQEHGKEGEDHNDFTYFPFNNKMHKKSHYKSTLAISSRDLENELLSQY